MPRRCALKGKMVGSGRRGAGSAARRRTNITTAVRLVPRADLARAVEAVVSGVSS